VAQHLGVSVATVRRLEASGKLHPEIGARSVRLHDPAEVRALREFRAVQEGTGPSVDVETEPEDPPWTPTEDLDSGADGRDPSTPSHGAIFCLLRRGLDPTEVVEELDIPAQHVHMAMTWFKRLRQEALLPPDSRDELREIRSMVNVLGESLTKLYLRFASVVQCPRCGGSSYLAVRAHSQCCGAQLDV